MWFHAWLGAGHDPFVKLVRVVYCVRLFAGINITLRVLGICLVGSTIVNSLTRY